MRAIETCRLAFAAQSILEIELDASTSPSPWTAFGYTAFAHVR
jgi:hypothetical protein